jgi:hypothetical protein
MKIFKRTISIFFTVFIISTTMLSSCKKDDAESAKQTLMNHKWEMKSVETSDALLKASYDLALALITPTYVFNEDGTYDVTYSTFLGEGESDSGTWSISDDGTELTIDGSATEIVELTKDVLKVKGTDEMMTGITGEEEGTTPIDMTIIFEAK